MTKTVFILGAGFSVPAKIPQQNKLLKMVFSAEIADMSWSVRIEKARSNIADFVLRFFSNKNYIDFLDENDTLIIDYLVDNCDFLVDTNGSSNLLNLNFEEEVDYSQILFKIKHLNENNRLEAIDLIIEAKEKDNGLFNKKIYTYIENHKDKVTLEDVFTVLDKAILSKEHFQIYDSSKLIELREDLIFCIILLFKHSDACEIELYQEFTHYLINKRIAENYEENQFSIITLNWDMTIEKNMYLAVETSKNEDVKKVRLDYCVYDNDFDVISDRHSSKELYCTPSTLLKAKGFNNIKMMKLHGSVNWLTCRKCQRLYYSFDSYLALECYRETSFPVCPKCRSRKPFDKNSKTRIQADLITPTMIKDLNNVILRNTWENASLDLSEAEKIIFIGYSLPQADFEFRYLMKKSISPDVEIEVILSESDDPSTLEEKYFWVKSFLPEERYQSFFSNDNIKFYYSGVEGFVNSLSN